MTTSLNVSVPTRDIAYGAVQAITRTVGFSTPLISTADTIAIGRLPAGSQIVSCIVRITAAFNAATTNVLTVGTSFGSNADVISDADLSEGVVGTTIGTRGCDLSFSADTTIYAKYTQTGTAATTGSAVITILYVATSNG